ncbi:hypothetical protein DFP72DRAFT_1081809 [Ephemerocybe angulata]|uniref:Uncharacterized protein n=1 Tax=Ephemerocybe angulata TaxID=980116 RepID=A0A8H6HAF3_9AGAR|nr:hypothetical protein DFP72DRAFT_1081809 [Tulosesus angulatus]
MGRRPKYLTVEAKKQARTEQRRVLNKRPNTANIRCEENQRYYYKHKLPPMVPSDVKHHAKLPISWTMWNSIFERFKAGQDMLVLDELELDEEDLQSLLGPPPYPTHLTTSKHFEDVWGAVSAAMHGLLTWEYVGDLNRRISSIVGKSDVTVRIELWASYLDLLARRKALLAHLSSLSLCYHTPSDMITFINVMWLSRLTVYTAEDLASMYLGRATLLRTWLDRVWDLEHV